MREPVRIQKRFTDPSERHKPPDKRRRFDVLLVWHDRSGKRRYRTVVDSSDPKWKIKAQNAKRTKTRELEDRASAPTDPIPWNDFVRDHMERVRESVRPSTILQFEHVASQFSQACKPDTVQAVSYEMIERFRAYAMAPYRGQSGKPRTRSKATVGVWLRTLKSMLSSAHKRGLIPQNSFTGLAIPKTGARDWHLFTSDETARLLKAAPSLWWRSFIQLCYTSALRKGEALHLLWDELDDDAGVIRVRPHKGKGLILPWEPKDADARDLPLEPVTAKGLRDLRASFRAISPYVFLSADRLRFLREKWRVEKLLPQTAMNNTNRDFDRMIRSAKIVSGTIHDLRRSWITNWLTDGVPPHEVQRWAGHSSIETTMKFYVKPHESALKRAREASARSMQRVTAAG